MNKLLMGSAVAVMVVAVAPAVAQVAPPPGVAQGTSVAPPMVRRGQPNVMIMMNKPMTRAEVSEHVARMFAHLDANHDGYLTREEIQATHQKMMAMGPEMKKRMAQRGMGRGDGL